MMKISRKITLFLLIAAVILSMTLPTTVLADDKTTQQKAEALNTLHVITGTNGNYSLNNQLRRYEAMVFIVRLIGKADYVTLNKDKYSTTPFTDVPATEGYAAYIGYGLENGFIPVGTQYKPMDFITEKELLKLVLVALDYRENTDFTSDKILEKALDLKLIVLADINNIISSKYITRSRAVEILYTALKTPCRPGDKMLSQKLVDAGITTINQLIALNLFVDKTVSAIQKIESPDLDRIEIKLNEAIISIAGINIYAADNDRDLLDYQIESVSNDTIVVSTETMDVSKNYVVQLISVKDTNGIITDKVSATFKGFEPKEVDSKFFRIRKIEPVNERSIKVYFTHPVTLNSEVSLNYTILKNNQTILDGKLGTIKASLLSSVENGVMLSTNSNIFNDESLYDLMIDGNMVSAYGARLNNGLGDSMKFVGRESDGSQFVLQSITPIDKQTVLLDFNKEVNPFLAQQIYNFYITDSDNNPVRIATTAVHSNKHAVYLNLGNEMTKNANYNLTINNLNDITKLEYITEQSYPFTANYGTSDRFDLDGIAFIDNQTMEVYFNNPLDSVTAVKTSNYTISRTGSSTITPDKVLYDPLINPNKVKLFFSANNKLNATQGQYELRIDSTMKDYLGKTIYTTKRAFGGISSNKVDITLSEVVPVSNNAVKLTFSKEIAFSSPNIVPSNFTLEYTYNNLLAIKKIPISIIYINTNTLILQFDSLDYGIPYKLKAAQIIDYSGSLVKAKEIAFQLQAE